MSEAIVYFVTKVSVCKTCNGSGEDLEEVERCPRCKGVATVVSRATLVEALADLGFKVPYEY